MIFVYLFLSLLAAVATAEDGSRAWLRYAPVPQADNYRSHPSSIIALNSTKSSPVYTAGQELQHGIKGIFGKQLGINGTSNSRPAIIVGTVDAYRKAYGNFDEADGLEEDGFFLSTEGDNVVIVGQNERGALYGAFDYLSRLAQAKFSTVSYVSNPHAPIRWVNQWDNMDGSIERGYAGPSIFFQNGFVVTNTTRVAEYARLLASIRINGIVINNVNANVTLLSSRNMDGLGRLADAMRPYGVQLGISLNFASPQTFGGLSTFDPLDPAVDAWWANITDQIYTRVPDMAGYLVKANSEGQPGPLTYNRTLADGANMFARATKPHGGIVMFRAFVYDNHINETNWKNDRANAAVDFFKDLDGKFDDNVVVQIKYGPIDFQVREPASPLFSTLRKTNTAIELQVTQEYLGQQCHLVYLAPLWKEILEFDMKADDRPSKVKDIISGERFSRPIGGFAAVVNVGTNATWLGSHLAMSVSAACVSCHFHCKTLIAAELVRIRHHGMGSCSPIRGSPRKLDTLDVRVQPRCHGHDHGHVHEVMASLRELLREPRHSDLDRYSVYSLRSKSGLSGWQWLGSVDARRLIQHRHGSYREEWNRERRSILPSSRSGVREHQHYTGQPPAMVSPCQLHPTPKVRKDGDPALLRRALRRCSYRANFRQAMGIAPRQDRRRTI